MTSPGPDVVSALLRESLNAWGVAGTVMSPGDGSIEVESRGQRLRVEPASPDLPFRWIVRVGDRQRIAISLVAVLRQVRDTLDPGYSRARVRIAGSPPDAAGPTRGDVSDLKHDQVSGGMS